MARQATEATQKGEVVFEQVPKLLVQTRASRKRCFLCGNCGVPCGSPSQQLSLARGQPRRAAIERPLHTLPVLLGQSPQSCCLCPAKGCDEVFCSETCRDSACIHGTHPVLCCSRSESSNSYELQRVATESGEAILLAAKLIAQVAKAWHSKQSSSPEAQLLQEFLHAGGRDFSGSCLADMPDDVNESRLLLSLVLVHDLGWLSKEDLQVSPTVDSGTPSVLATIQAALTESGYASLVRQLQKVAIRLEMPSPLVQYCGELLRATPHLVASALSVFGPFVEVALKGEAMVQQPSDDKCISGSTVSHLERKAARLAQAGEAAMWGGENPFAAAGGCLLAVVEPLEHSCVPNTSLEVGRSMGSLRAQFRALRTIMKGEVMTVACIAIDAPLSDRNLALQKRFGPDFICDCMRCRSDHWGKDAGLSAEQLRELAEQATQHAMHDDAFRYYSEVLKLLPQDGDALHSRGVARYEAGHWAEGNRLFEEGAALAPDHVLLKAEAQKIKAYEHLHANRGSTVQLPLWESFLDNTCFMSAGASPVLSAAECASAIKSAEDFAAAQGGWTTVRHYAVPTTDLNIHEVPELLEWFLKLMGQKLAPLLAAQFGEDVMGERGEHIRVGDAFLVKYTLDSGSKHIPVHKDYSTHSLTIALNPSSEYGGGGTYFCKLGRSLRPDLGHVVSFSGDLAHGGDPITHGVRYIIAVFMYTDSGDDNALASQGSAKRQKTKMIDHGRLKPLLRESSSTQESIHCEAEESDNVNGGASWLLSLDPGGD